MFVVSFAVLVLALLVLYAPALVQVGHHPATHTHYSALSARAGELAPLSRGQLHYVYTLAADPDAPTVLVLHGISTSSFSLRVSVPHPPRVRLRSRSRRLVSRIAQPITDGLSRAGLSTLAIDLPGRGHSEPFAGPYNDGQCAAPRPQSLRAFVFSLSRCALSPLFARAVAALVVVLGLALSAASILESIASNGFLARGRRRPRWHASERIATALSLSRVDASQCGALRLAC